MEESAGLLGFLPILLMVIVAIYYGMGKNVEVGSRMLTRELIDAERLQKERILRKYSSRGKDEFTDASFKKAKDTIQKLDELDI